MIWLTRSDPGATRLSHVLRELGYDVWCRPVIDVEPLEPWYALELEGAYEQRSAGFVPAYVPDLVIVLSAHAARAYAQTPLRERAATVQHVAIGEQTGMALRELGLDVIIAGDATSEGLLQLPQLQALRARHRVWIMAGEGGRDVIQNHLLQNVACSVVKFELYRRRAQAVQDIPCSQIGIVEVASNTALEYFSRLWRACGGGNEVQLIAPSARVCETARAMGFENVHNARGATPQKVAAALVQLLPERGGRQQR